jgi:hypothetical protein
VLPQQAEIVERALAAHSERTPEGVAV